MIFVKIIIIEKQSSILNSFPFKCCYYILLCSLSVPHWTTQNSSLTLPYHRGLSLIVKIHKPVGIFKNIKTSSNCSFAINLHYRASYEIKKKNTRLFTNSISSLHPHNFRNRITLSLPRSRITLYLNQSFSFNACMLNALPLPWILNTV